LLPARYPNVSQDRTGRSTWPTVRAVARPFRHQPPALPRQAVARDRLLAALEQRWEQRLVAVVAGPGFGKTALLAAAVIAATDRPVRDVWLSCEPSDDAATNLTAGLVEAFGLPRTERIERLLDAVWSLAPEPVCFVIDDSHHVSPGSEGAAVLQRLVDDLPANGHVVLAAREAIPVPTARLVANGQALLLREADLVFDGDELSAFALARGVDPAVLASSAGWPAVAELAASAHADLVLDYLWEEVLAGLGSDRARLLATLSVAGGGDTRVASAIAGHPIDVDELVAGLPLVQRSSTGWAELHALWGPPLRRLLTDEEADDARRRAAAAHLHAGRITAAADLLAESESWDELLAVIRDAVIAGALTDHPATDYGRWYRALPASRRLDPEALLAFAVNSRMVDTEAALPALVDAVRGFRVAGDVDGEVAAIHEEGLLRWWSGDLAGLLELHVRVTELAAGGSRGAQVLASIGKAAMAHLTGDSAAVHDALEGCSDEVATHWRPIVAWFRSVAFRRDGDLDRSLQDLDRVARDVVDPDPQHDVARSRVAWLRGDVDAVVATLTDVCDRYATSARYLLAESTLELAARRAWLGDVAGARSALDSVPADLAALNPLTRTLELIAGAAIAVAEGDDPAAGALVQASGDAAPGRPEAWYWWDRAALALVHVLRPEGRELWAVASRAEVHRPGLVLAGALQAARDGDLGPARQLQWPASGIVRAHLPRRWALELAIAGHAAGNPPPDDLLDRLGDDARADVGSLAANLATAPVASAATALHSSLPPVPGYQLRVGVLGPFILWRDGEAVEHPDLRRRRVRELLCHLAARRRVRREELADELWPDHDDPARNLRVTLSYAQRVLQPERADGESPYFLRSQGAWLVLGGERLGVDAWELDEGLDHADSAERAGTPAEALVAYRRIVGLWRGEVYSDVSEASWVLAERARLHERYAAATRRAGELLLAAGDVDGARRMARASLAAEPGAEPSYSLLVRACAATGDQAGVRRAVDECTAALAALGLEPSPALLAAPG
jgi:DNA-binding SARP family transcriptional activator